MSVRSSWFPNQGNNILSISNSGHAPRYMRQYDDLYSSSNVFVQVCLNVCIGNNGTVTTQLSSKIIKKKSFLSVSLHCFKCNYVKTKRVICCGVAYRAVWLHICSFCVNNLSIWHFLCFPVEGILDLCGLGGEYVQWQKELQHCIVTYSQELNIMHTQSILYS